MGLPDATQHATRGYSRRENTTLIERVFSGLLFHLICSSIVGSGEADQQPRWIMQVSWSRAKACLSVIIRACLTLLRASRNFGRATYALFIPLLRTRNLNSLGFNSFSGPVTIPSCLVFFRSIVMDYNAYVLWRTLCQGSVPMVQWFSLWLVAPYPGGS